MSVTDVARLHPQQLLTRVNVTSRKHGGQRRGAVNISPSRYRRLVPIRHSFTERGGWRAGRFLSLIVFWWPEILESRWRLTLQPSLRLSSATLEGALPSLGTLFILIILIPTRRLWHLPARGDYLFLFLYLLCNVGSSPPWTIRWFWICCSAVVSAPTEDTVALIRVHVSAHVVHVSLHQHNRIYSFQDVQDEVRPVQIELVFLWHWQWHLFWMKCVLHFWRLSKFWLGKSAKPEFRCFFLFNQENKSKNISIWHFVLLFCLFIRLSAKRAWET